MEQVEQVAVLMVVAVRLELQTQAVEVVEQLTVREPQVVQELQ
jgi:hypothetical protein